jgi:hypothetical protein
LNRPHSPNQAVGQQQRHQFGLVYKPETNTSLQLGGSEQELFAAWKIVCAACAILVFGASPFNPRVLAAQSFKISEAVMERQCLDSARLASMTNHLPCGVRTPDSVMRTPVKKSERVYASCAMAPKQDLA